MPHLVGGVSEENHEMKWARGEEEEMEDEREEEQEEWGYVEKEGTVEVMTYRIVCRTACQKT